MERLKSEELWIAQCYNGDAALVNEENDAIKFVIPKEGTGFWMDKMATRYKGDSEFYEANQK